MKKKKILDLILSVNDVILYVRGGKVAKLKKYNKL